MGVLGVCGDNRFEIIAKVKERLIEATNIESHPEELEQLDNILFRLWQLDYFETISNFTSSSDKRLEPILQKLKDLGVIKSWYYNGAYHAS